MHRRRPAARHEKRVAGDCSASARRCSMRTALTRSRPSTPRISAPCATSMPGRARGLGQRPFASGRRSAISATSTPASLQIERGAIGAVVRGRDDHALADLDAILAAIAPRGVGEHHARAVVIREHQRTLDRAGRQHDLARAHLPQPLARQVGIGDEVRLGDALVQGDEVLRVIAERLRSRHQAQVGPVSKRRDRFRQPIARAHGLDRGLVSARSEPPSGRVLVAEDDASAACARGQRRGEPGRAAADDQDVAMGERPLIAVGIGLARTRRRGPRRGGSPARRHASTPSSCRTGSDP